MTALAGFDRLDQRADRLEQAELDRLDQSAASTDDYPTEPSGVSGRT
jgi:hypothetical protein